MNELPSQDESRNEQALREKLAEIRQGLGHLVGELRSVDHELEELSGERQRFDVLGRACDALEELREQGADELFWGEGSLGGHGDETLRRARERMESFGKRVAEMEERRAALARDIAGRQGAAGWVEDEIYELERLEEERKLEWVVERQLADLPARETVMPWSRGGEDDERLRKTLAAALLLSLLLGLVFPMIDLPLPEPWEELELPDRLTRLIREERPIPPPPQELAQRPVETETETPEPSETPQPVPPESPKPDAASKGILAFREKFSGLADEVPASRLGASARINGSGQAGGTRTQRNLVATKAPNSSGGINLASLSRDVGGGEGIQGVTVARATSSIGGGGGNSDRPLSGGPGPSRTDEEIQIVFDRHKAGLYRLYNRELRRDPTLQGQMVLRLTIEPDGLVSMCELSSSDMNAPALSARVVERIKTFDFGAKEGVSAITILYPIDFLPAA